MAAQSRPFLAVILAGLGGLAGCGHIIHPAKVQPGFAVDFLVGAEAPLHGPLASENLINQELRTTPPFRTHEVVAQFRFGYGWRFASGRGVQLGLSLGTMTAPALDAYGQFLAGWLDAGLGVTGGLSVATAVVPSVYTMVGKGLPLGSGGELRLDAGYRYIPSPRSSDRESSGHGPMALLSYTRDRFMVGLWADYLDLDHNILRTYATTSAPPTTPSPPSPPVASSSATAGAETAGPRGAIGRARSCRARKLALAPWRRTATWPGVMLWKKAPRAHGA